MKEGGFLMKLLKKLFKKREFILREKRPSLEEDGDATWVCGGQDC